MNHTDERDAYEHIVKQQTGFQSDWWLRKDSKGMYWDATIQFGWQIYQKTLLMMIERANHA